mgnify:CR=1 FL=1
MRDEVERATQRAQRYWFDDGLAEIGIGAILLLIGLMFYAEAVVPPSALPTGFSSIGLIVIVFGGWWLAGRLVKAAKARLTYPRTGYVSYARPRKRRLGAAVVIGAGTAALVAVLFATAPASLAWLPALQGLLGAAFTVYVAYRFALGRFYVLAVISVLVGASAALAGLGDLLGDAVYYGTMGISFIVSGLLTLYGYLRRHQRPAEG